MLCIKCVWSDLGKYGNTSLHQRTYGSIRPSRVGTVGLCLESESLKIAILNFSQMESRFFFRSGPATTVLVERIATASMMQMSATKTGTK
jgi:hypothetical protein